MASVVLPKQMWHFFCAALAHQQALDGLVWSAVHTMAELKLSGNHLKGSRPVLSFDKARLRSCRFTYHQSHPRISSRAAS